jgi:hypothetical protein
MAIHLEANYSKKLGLPGYSSHQYSVTIKTEVSDANQVQLESTRLYDLLQSCVDREIQKTGFLPAAHGSVSNNGNGRSETWQCSEKQRDLILKMVEEHKLEKATVEQLAQERFGKTVKSLNRLEASGLIDALIEKTGGTPGNQRRRFNGRGNPVNTR